MRNLQLWGSVYLCNTAPLADSHGDDHPDNADMPILAKTRSCDDIVAALEHTSNLNRTSSDPNIASDGHLDPKYLLQKEIDAVEKQRIEVNVAEDLVKFDARSPSLEDMKASDENSATESDTDDRTDTVNGEVEHEAVVENGVSEAGTENGIHSMDDVQNGNDCIENGIDHDRGIIGFVKPINGLVNGTADLSNGPGVEQNCDIPDSEHLSVESSTDTLTGVAELVKSASSPAKLSLEEINLNKLATISTSTTDISDSHVRIDLNEKFCFNGQSLKINDLTLTLAPSNGDLAKQTRSCQTDSQKRTSFSKGSTTGSESSGSTPYNSRTPISSCPETPATDNKVRTAFGLILTTFRPQSPPQSNCKKEYLVLALGEETAVRAVVVSIF